VIDLVPEDETEAAQKMRSERRAWLGERGYRVLDVGAKSVDADLSGVLDGLAEAIVESQ
jgi:tRNA/rRNA methyltransferase